MDTNSGDIFTGAIHLTQEKPFWITFACGLSINPATGEVVIPEGLSLDDASRAFWDGLQRLAPKGS